MRFRSRAVAYVFTRVTLTQDVDRCDRQAQTFGRAGDRGRCQSPALSGWRHRAPY